MQRSNTFVTSSWDDVTKLDLKTCELLEDYRLKATFFAVGNWIGKKISEEELRQISNCNEIGAHTLNHVDLTKVDTVTAAREIFESKSLLDEILGKPTASFAYPFGHYKKIHVEMVRNANYSCARTTKPFFTKCPDNPYEINVTIWAYPHAFRDMTGMLRLLNLLHGIDFDFLKVKKWNELGKRIFDGILESGGVFHLMGHTWQVEEMKQWQKLEDLLAYISNRKDLTYLTMSEYVSLLFHRNTE